MSINRQCPMCGSTKVQLSNEESKHGCLWLVIFGIFYVFWLIMKWFVGITILVCYDWWMSIIQSKSGKGYVWQSKKWFSGRRRIYYCHDCGHNFRA